jgi:S-(hydroxymethyl)glutathione dehydrogenase / alcohol dehydrogenase
VLVRVLAAGVCHSDLHFMESRDQDAALGLYGLRQDHRLQPGMAARRSEEAEAELLVMGHEPCGVVEEVGALVTMVRPGDRVVGVGMSYCGRCRQCLGGRPHMCLALPRRAVDDAPRLSHDGRRVTQFANLGAFAAQMLVHETSLVKIGDDIAPAQAAILGCSIATGVGAALNTARVAPGSTVAVFGTGGIGLSVVQGARIAGAQTIVAVDPAAGKRAVALRLGATHTIDPDALDVDEAIAELTAGAGVDYAFETTSIPAVAQQAYEALGLRGLLVCMAGTPTDVRTMVGTERTITGCFLGSSRPQIDLPFYLELHRQGRLLLDEMVGAELPPEDFASVAGLLAGGEVPRVVLRFSD